MNAPAPTEDKQKVWLDADRIFLVLLAVAFPAAVASHFFFPGTNTFVLCAVAIIPLARLMGEATEVIAHQVGSGLGGLMNASFGNAAELIIALVALKEGYYGIVKASLTGSILGNILLVLGASCLAGGLKHKDLKFNAAGARMMSTMLTLAAVALVMPAAFHYLVHPIAKVERDRLMVDACALYPGYGFARHKGYGAPEHQRALLELGPCAIHRMSFKQVQLTAARYGLRTAS